MQCESFMRPRDILPQMAAIAGVAEHSMTGFRKMNANLITAARFKTNGHMRHRGTERSTRKILHHLIQRDGQLAVVFVRRRESSEVFAGRQITAKLSLLLNNVLPTVISVLAE